MEELFLYEQALKPKDIITHLLESFRNKLSKKEREAVIAAFYLTVLEYKNKNEENNLNKMLI